MHPLIPYFERIEIPIGGVINIHGFGILVAVGFITGSWLAARKATRDGLDPDIINRWVTWLIAGVFIGGHLGHALFYEPAEHFADPIKFLMVWEGLSSFGGFIGCTILSLIFFRIENRKVRKANTIRKQNGEPLKFPVKALVYGDTGVYGFTLGWFFGRMGCFSAHDHPGIVTEFWLGVYGMCPDQPVTVACHDLGLYEAIWALGVCFLFLWLDRKPRFQGFYIGLICLLYGPTRLFMDVFRHPDTDARYFGLTPAQYGSMLIFLIGVTILIKQRNTTPARVLTGFNIKKGAEKGDEAEA
jgi:phosphatidylglycerol:prolipoprotein diacylglycerol transferase